MEGYYYLHENGQLIYKRELGETAADLRESSFVRAFWPVDPSDRETAWTILIEGAASGALESQIASLAQKWGCTDKDADVYADRVGCNLLKDGNVWCATTKSFINLQESPAGFGQTKLKAMISLAIDLGYKPSKMWGNSFKGLLKKAEK